MGDTVDLLVHIAKKAELNTEKRRRRDQERKLEVARKQKEADELAYKKVWGWKEEGQITARNVHHAFAGVKAILIPHKSKKVTMIEFAEVITATQEDSTFSWMRLSQRLLNTIRPLQILYRQKYRSIHRKHTVIREIHSKTRALMSLHMQRDDYFPYDYPLTEEAALLPMEAAHARRIPVGPAKILLLRMLRSKVQAAQEKLQRAVDGIDRCEYMLVCTSIYHGRLTGCSKCGLVTMKGVMHVESYDRVTNSSVIVPRDYEMDVLEKEKVEYTRLYNVLRGQLNRVEEELRMKTVYDIQAWWATRMAIRRARQQRLRMEKSLLRRRIKRLVKMKRAIDTFDPWVNTLEKLELEYCDVLPELSEYRLKKTKKAMQIALRFARRILDIAKKKHAATVFKERYKERRRYERLASVEMQRQREKRVEQSLRHQLVEKTKNMLARTWMCDRFECSKRVFLSEFRYTTHMKLHRLKDTKGMKSREELYRLKVARRRKEELFLARVNLLREGIIHVRGDGGDSSTSPIKAAQLPKGSRRYMTKLPPLPRSRTASLDDCVGYDHTDGGAVTANDLLDEYELNALLSDNGHSGNEIQKSLSGDEEREEYEQSKAFDNLLLNIGHSDMDTSNRECDPHDSNNFDYECNVDAAPVQKSILGEAGVGSAGSGVGEAALGHCNPNISVIDESTSPPATSCPPSDTEKSMNKEEHDETSLHADGKSEESLGTPPRAGPYAARKWTGKLSTSQPNGPDIQRSLSVEGENRMEYDDQNKVTRIQPDKKALLEDRIQCRQLTPSWLRMPQLTMLSESVQSNMKMTLEVVSKVDSVYISSPKVVLDKHVFRIGTLASCDYSIKCNDNGGDIRQVRRVSRIHCLLYVPLILQKYSSAHHHHHNHAEESSPAAGTRQSVLDRTATGGDGMGDYDEVESQKHVTIVDNHSAWGTYVVSVNGVRRVPTNVQKGLALIPGDLICVGVVRNGPPTMSPIDANKALIVFRVRIE